MTDTTQDMSALQMHWQALHREPRHLLSHPSEAVIRWRHAHLPKPALASDRVLDIGCAGGRHTFFLATEGFGVDAVDIADAATATVAERAARYGPRVKTKTVAADALDFADANFAGVLSFGVYTYMDNAAVKASLQQIRRMLRPGGTLFLVTRAHSDWRANFGTRLSNGYVRADRLADTPAEPENGLTMNLPDRNQVESWLSDFHDAEINFQSWTTNGGRYVNVDWHVVATR